MKKFSFLLCFCFMLLFSQNTSASHVAGADITYRCEGNGVYTFFIKMYRDCSGVRIDPSTSPLILKCGSSTLQSPISLVSLRDVTGYGPCLLSSCSGNGYYGIEEHILQTTVDL